MWKNIDYKQLNIIYLPSRKLPKIAKVWHKITIFRPNMVKCGQLSTGQITTTKYSKNQDGLPSPNDTEITGRTQCRMKTEVFSFHPALNYLLWNRCQQFSLPKWLGRKHPYYILATTKSKDYKLFWKYMKFVTFRLISIAVREVDNYS